MHICEEDQLAQAWYAQGKIAHGDMDVTIHAGDTDLVLLSRKVSFDIVIESATFRERHASPISDIIPLMSAGALYFLSGLRTSYQSTFNPSLAFSTTMQYLRSKVVICGVKQRAAMEVTRWGKRSWIR